MSKFIFLLLFLTMICAGSSYSQTIIAPDGLEAQSEDSSYLKVKWHDNSNNEEGFYIERSLDNTSNWEIIGAASQNQISYFDYWVTRGRTYYYRVYAYNGSLRSNYSNTAYAVLLGDPSIIPAIPSNLEVTEIKMTSIRISWQDNSNNERGFIIARKTQNDSFYQYIDTVGTDILTFQEVGLTPDNVYTYKVCSYVDAGISEYSNTVTARTKQNTIIINNISQTPDKFFLGNNYPNPFNPSTNIKFGITANSFVKIVIYNSLGKEIDNLLDQNLIAGTYIVKWEAKNIPSGIYFYKMETGGLNGPDQKYSEIKKMILIK